MTSPLSRRDLARAALLAAVTVAIWMVATSAWRREAWAAPPEYTIDALETLARVELAGEKGLRFFVDKKMARLGAPFVADWTPYPMPDVPVFLLLGALARTFGLAAAGQLAILLAALLNVLAFYFCSRTLGHRPPFAGAAAVLFAFSHFNLSRGLSHYSLTLSFVVPAGLLVAWLVGSSRRLLAARRWQLVCLGIAAITGTASPYYGLMFAVLLVLALFHQALTVRRRSSLVTGAGCLLVWGAVLFACHYQAIGAAFCEGRKIMVRNWVGIEILGLRPIEMIMPPPGHRLPGASDLAELYARSTSMKGESSMSYLGVFGLLGVAVAATAFLRALVRRRASLRPAHVPMMALAVALGMVGGLIGVFVITITDVFRAGNRYTVYVLTIGLLALAGWASARWGRRRAVTARLVVAAVVSIGLWDSLRPIPTQEDQAVRAVAAELDRQLGCELEQVLSPGSMVFQLPVVSFLEQRPVGRVSDCAEFLPFLCTSNLRFSYGSLAGQGAMVWQRRVARMPLAAMRAELEATGFSALHICRSAYPGLGGELRRSGEAAGMQILFDAGDHLVFRLNPASSPKMPEPLGPNRYPLWDRLAWEAGGLAILEISGWYEPETQGSSLWRWGSKEATCALWNGTGVAREVRVRCEVTGFGRPATREREQLSVSVDSGPERRGPDLWRNDLDVGPIPCQFSLHLEPGETHLRWRFTGTPRLGPRPDTRQLGFKVADIVVEEN